MLDFLHFCHAFFCHLTNLILSLNSRRKIVDDENFKFLMLYVSLG